MTRINDLADRFFEKTKEAESGCIEWTGGRFRSGYGSFDVAGQSLRAHRVAWLLAYGEIFSDMHVLHKCDNPGCVNVQHLYLGTHDTNMRDKVVKKRWRGNTKITRENIAKIRELYATGNFTQQEIAGQFHLSDSRVSDYVRGIDPLHFND